MGMSHNEKRARLLVLTYAIDAKQGAEAMEREIKRGNGKRAAYIGLYRCIPDLKKALVYQKEVKHYEAKRAALKKAARYNLIASQNLQ